MKIKTLIQCVFWSLLVSLLVPACVPRFETIRMTGLPASVSQPGTPGVDVGTVLANARYQVQQVLPNSYLASFTFSGKCEGLPGLHGTINLRFIQVRSGILRRQVLSGAASVNTIEETMDLRFEDISAYYPSTVPLVLDDGLSVAEVGTIAHKYIATLELPNCDVILTRLEETWLVVCTQPGSGVLGPRVCEFEIDALTGQIITAEQ